jgi:hypothetical protein
MLREIVSGLVSLVALASVSQTSLAAEPDDYSCPAVIEHNLEEHYAKMALFPGQEAVLRQMYCKHAQTKSDHNYEEDISELESLNVIDVDPLLGILYFRQAQFLDDRLTFVSLMQTTKGELLRKYDGDIDKAKAEYKSLKLVQERANKKKLIDKTFEMYHSAEDTLKRFEEQVSINRGEINSALWRIHLKLD